MPESAVVKVGGQALADGVLMRTPLAWAVARADGTIDVGDGPPSRGSGIPGIRVLVGLAAGLKLGFGRGLLARPKGGNLRFLLVVLGLEAALVAAPAVLPEISLPPALAVAAATLPWIVSLTVIRLAAPKQMWRYHGAEHKAVSAHEAGAAADDVAAAMAASRIHDRCGTNLVFLMILAGFALMATPAVWQFVGFLVSLAAVVEVLGVAARHPRALWSRALLVGGRFLQARLTTAEPGWGEQAVACRALGAALERHHELTTDVTLAPATAPLAPTVTTAAR